MDSPKPFIEVDEDGKLLINEDTARLLETHRKPVVAVAIVGKARRGKSYLMNRLLRRQRGFPLGSTIEAATRGIWAWITDHPEKENTYLLLLDTEGLSHASDGDENRDVHIFVLSIILSSSLIYNCQGVIDESCLELLDLVSQLSEHLILREDSDGNLNELDSLFPTLYFVVRDFMLELNIAGKRCSPSEYLEHCLKEKRGFGPRTMNQNDQRGKLKSYFPDRHCFVLPRPVASGEDLNRVDSLNESSLSQEFVRGVSEIVGNIHAQSNPKKIGGRMLNGCHLVTVARSCVQAFRENKIPSVENAVTAVRQAECIKAFDQALETYKVSMEDTIQDLPMDEDVLGKKHQNCVAIAKTMFFELAIFDDHDEFYNKMQEAIKREYDAVCSQNESEAMRLCREVLDVLFTGIVQQKIDDGTYSSSEGHCLYIQDLQKVMIAFDEYPKKGPAFCAKKVGIDFENEKHTQAQLIHQTAEAVASKENDMETHRVLMEMQQAQSAEVEQAMMAQLAQLQTDFEEQLHVQAREKGQMRESYEEKIRQKDSLRRREVNIKDAEVERIKAELERRQRLNEVKLETERSRANQDASQIRLLQEQNKNLEEGLRHAQNHGGGGGGGGCAIM